MKNYKKGFVIPLIIAIIALLGIGGGAYVYVNKKSAEKLENSFKEIAKNQVATTTNTSERSSTTEPVRLEEFEKTINNGDLNSIKKYFSDKVYVVLDGSSCCGEQDVNYFISNALSGIKGASFVFDQNDLLVKEYLDYKIHLDGDLIIGVQSNSLTNTKKVIAYRVSGNKIVYFVISDFITKLTSENSTPASIITSISTSSGPIGTSIDIFGHNFAGFEGDLGVDIENEVGKTAYIFSSLAGGYPTLYKTIYPGKELIRITIPDKVCETAYSDSYSGNPCKSFMEIVPGTYKISVKGNSERSNVVMFTVTLGDIWKTYNFESFEIKYPEDSIVAFSNKENKISVPFKDVGFLNISIFIPEQNDYPCGGYGPGIASKHVFEPMIINGEKINVDTWIEDGEKYYEKTGDLKDKNFYSKSGQVCEGSFSIIYRFDFKDLTDRTYLESINKLVSGILSTFKFK
jgi:ketosteroid isomerase-like protein